MAGPVAGEESTDAKLDEDAARNSAACDGRLEAAGNSGDGTGADAVAVAVEGDGCGTAGVVGLQAAGC